MLVEIRAFSNENRTSFAGERSRSMSSLRASQVDGLTRVAVIIPGHLLWRVGFIEIRDRAQCIRSYAFQESRASSAVLGWISCRTTHRALSSFVLIIPGHLLWRVGFIEIRDRSQ